MNLATVFRLTVLLTISVVAFDGCIVLADAVGAYKKAIELDPIYADAHNNLTISYCTVKDYRSAWT